MTIKPNYVIYDKHDAVLTIKEISTIMTVLINEMQEFYYLMPEFLRLAKEYIKVRNNGGKTVILSSDGLYESIVLSELDSSCEKAVKEYYGIF